MNTVHLLDRNSEIFDLLAVELLMAGSSLRFTAHGSSMQPLVRDGDVLLIEPVLNKPLRLGMVVLCLAPNGKIMVHRVIGRQQDQQEHKYLIQGDHVGKSDGWFSRKNIHGEISLIERDGVTIDLRTPRARLVALMVVLRSRRKLKGTVRLISNFYSKIKQFRIFRIFFS